MTRRTVTVLAALLLLPLLSVAQVSNLGVVAKVDFAFVANGKSLPAGTYEFRTEGLSDATLVAMNTQTRQSTLIPILTSVSPRQQNLAEVVFDKTGDNYYLSEVYFPGQDGVLLQGANVKHTHTVVKASKN